MQSSINRVRLNAKEAALSSVIILTAVCALTTLLLGTAPWL